MVKSKHEGGKSSMIMPDYTLFLQLANFLFLLFILNIILYRPVRQILGKRKAEVDGLQRSVSELEGNANRFAGELEEGMAKARKAGYQEKENLKNQGLEEEKSLLKEAASASGERMGQARTEMEKKLLEARGALAKELSLFSKELAEKILGRSV
jgi:F-type H+-transporting ATPase subunit b